MDVLYISIDFLMMIHAMPRRLPPLNALKAFEAAARHESFTRAADELCVTQGAVSQQVKALEVSLGVTLFGRERQRLVITPAGREYLAVIRDALDRIAMGTERLVQGRGSGVLTVSTSPDFAAKWLVHRLGRFVESHPEIDLQGLRDHASRRLRARGRRRRRPSRRREVAGARRRASVFRAALSGVQPEAALGASSHRHGVGFAEIPTLAPRRLDRLDQMVRGGRRRKSRCCAARPSIARAC